MKLAAETTLTPEIRNLASGHSLVLLAPDNGVLPPRFGRAEVDTRRYDSLLHAMQRMRGAIYLRDGAITPSQLESDGRHVVDADRISWHVLSLNNGGQVTGCSRYLCHEQDASFEELTVGHASLVHDPAWGRRFRKAIESEVANARADNLAFVEVGGWAVHESLRFTTEALRVALSTYALARWLGGCIGITTATVRNCSSRILRKIGGTPLQLDGARIPPYYDPRYRCEMEVLRFDSRRPDSRFLPWIEPIYRQLAGAPVVWRTTKVARPIPVHPRAATWDYAVPQACLQWRAASS
ncbi:MAG: hypothetical protein ACKV22_32230 [Bryobacteraceae bacterium]